MSVELSPSQERRLHSILDRGFDTLHESAENNSYSTQGKYNRSGNLEESYRNSSQKFIHSPTQTQKSRIINSELKCLQEKLATLEAKLSKNSDPKPPKSRAKSPAVLQKHTAGNSPRVAVNRSKRHISRERIRNIENSEKEINKMERSITPSPARSSVPSRRIERSRATSSNKDKKNEEKIKKENDILRRELAKLEDVQILYIKLQDEHSKLGAAYERSEKIRIKQKGLINHLKNELKDYNEENLSQGNKVRRRYHKALL